jgi:hypothetical protein
MKENKKKDTFHKDISNKVTTQFLSLNILMDKSKFNQRAIKSNVISNRPNSQENPFGLIQQKHNQFTQPFKNGPNSIELI